MRSRTGAEIVAAVHHHALRTDLRRRGRIEVVTVDRPDLDDCPQLSPRIRGWR